MSKNRKGGTPQKKNGGLVMMNFQVPQDLYRRFKAKVVKDGVSIRRVAEAYLEAYLRGEFILEEEYKASLKKG